ncbi:hypothetical protein F2Q69_00047195 [Brassica cretica]|uniref:Uncharacterized protein n=1 Tax=Brassica cretica TaxID=69181 RepID=A0A8S9PYN8_BRACR|nr:hypothetical protein F2Q69_00047195 [Brassica cretica]
MKEWLEKRVDHWNPEEEYQRHLFLSGGLNDLITRRLREYPGGRLGARRLWRSKGSPWILRSRLGPGCSRHTLRSFIWDPEVFSLGPGTETGARKRCLDPEISGWNPEIGGKHKDPEFLGNPECFVFPGIVLRLPRQDCYRKSLTGLEGAGVGVMTQVSGLRCFPSLEMQDLDCSLYISCWYSGDPDALGCTGVLGSFDSILSLAHTPSCFMSHTRFDSLWACHCGHATFVRVGQDRRSLET